MKGPHSQLESFSVTRDTQVEAAFLDLSWGHNFGGKGPRLQTRRNKGHLTSYEGLPNPLNFGLQ